jgi:DNA topoisomerase-6 subunit B
MVLAEELAKQQRSISVAEFFEKNKHLLGFDSPTRGVITTIKEAVDNSLDACEEAQVLPDLFISIKKVSNEVFRIIVEDNGPGIVPAQVPFVFGKLLYGSRFHQIRQTRGQQGIGISAAVLYAQLTSGVPTIVISRTGANGIGSMVHGYRSSSRARCRQRKNCSNTCGTPPLSTRMPVSVWNLMKNRSRSNG